MPLPGQVVTNLLVQKEEDHGTHEHSGHPLVQILLEVDGIRCSGRLRHLAEAIRVGEALTAEVVVEVGK